MEADLLAQRAQFQSDPQTRLKFLARLGLSPAECEATCISLFCYPDAPVAELFKVWQNSDQPITCLVPQGVASATLQHWVGSADRVSIGALTLRVIPFLTQNDYDRLLWSCAINFVRGEDSFIRAHWAQQPFIWNIYPQEEALHHTKLHAFLDRSGLRDHGPALSAFVLAWNGASSTAPDWQQLWQELNREHNNMGSFTRNWALSLSDNGDLAANLCHFCESIARTAPKLAL